jgi:predicted Zn-dependent protease
MIFSVRTVLAFFMTTVMMLWLVFPIQAANKRRQAPGRPHAAAPAGGVYPQYLLNGRPDHWIKEQMPIRVWVSHGLTLDGIVDNMGVPLTNTANKNNWPDLVISVMGNPQQLQTLPIAEGYSEQQYQAAIEGINLWKSLEREGLFSFQLTDNPEEADIYVFWTPHFVNKLGLALFENDIRGYTSVYALPYADVQAALQRGDVEMVKRSLKPVVTFLRTQEQDLTPISYGKMRASAAHEFGHALGIADHSPNRYDLMSVYYGNGVISGNDAATMRHLYRSVPYYMP